MLLFALIINSRSSAWDLADRPVGGCEGVGREKQGGQPYRWKGGRAGRVRPPSLPHLTGGPLWLRQLPVAGEPSPSTVGVGIGSSGMGRWGQGI